MGESWCRKNAFSLCYSKVEWNFVCGRWLSNCSGYLIVSFLEGGLCVHSGHGFVVVSRLKGIEVVRGYCQILLDYRFRC